MTELWLFISFQCKTWKISTIYSHFRQFRCCAHFLSAPLIIPSGSSGWLLQHQDFRSLTQTTVSSTRSWTLRKACYDEWKWEKKASQPCFFLFFSAVLIYPAFASISIYHLLKVTVVPVINPVNRWPRRQDSIYRASSNHQGKLVLPKSEWGNYLNHLRPSISAWCVWWVHRLPTLGPSLLLPSLWIYLVRVSLSISALQIIWEGVRQFNLRRVYSIGVRSVWNRRSSAATCAGVKVEVVEGRRVLQNLCCTDLLGSNTTTTSHNCWFRGWESAPAWGGIHPIIATLRTVAQRVQGGLLSRLVKNEPLITFPPPHPTPPSTFLFNY